MAIVLSLIFIVMDSWMVWEEERGNCLLFYIVKLSNKWKNVNSTMKCGTPTLELFRDGNKENRKRTLKLSVLFSY